MGTLPAGTVIGFSGRGWKSHLINLGTFGLPFLGLSHIGIINREGQLVESTSLDPETPCLVKGNRSGCKAVDLSERIRSYRGRVYAYPLTSRLLADERDALATWLRRQLGKPYDFVGALSSSGLGGSGVGALLRWHDPDALYCSELVAEALRKVNRFRSPSPNYSPNCLLRRLKWQGVVTCPQRLK